MEPVTRLVRTSSIAAISLVLTYGFFAEYLSPFRKVHIPYDLEGYHYPLTDYAFQALKQHRLPEWDWTIYSGQPFIGNIQAALFYPPTWLLFAANATRTHVSLQSMQVFVILHVWLAFILCYLWLRNRQLTDLASLVGAAIFAYSGFAMQSLQHMGLMGGYAWFPLGFWGIDQVVHTRNYRPLWKVIAASALCFLAGYPPVWVVFAVCIVSYALFSQASLGVVLGAILSLVASMALVMIQLLPAWEAAALKVSELRYGIGIRPADLLLSFLWSNFFDFGLNVNIHTNPGKDYLYLGSPCLIGLFLLVRRRNMKGIAPLLAVGIACLIFLTNPFGLVWAVIRHSTLLAQLCRDWYFLAGLMAALASLAAYGLDDFLGRPSRSPPPWLVRLSIALLLCWSVWLLLRWLPSGPGFASGWYSTADVTIAVLIVGLGFYMLRSQARPMRTYATLALLLTIGVEYKTFGTSKRVDAQPGSGQIYFAPDYFPLMDSATDQTLRANPAYRILSDATGPVSLDLRHYFGLRTPQGFDPLFSSQYLHLLENSARFRSNWEFDVGADQQGLLQLLGVKYLVTTPNGPFYSLCLSSPDFRLIGSSASYYRVFEYLHAQPSFGWDAVSGTVDLARWMPETRVLKVNSQTGGRFALHEQLFPGWQAAIDGHAVDLERWSGAFQSVSVPPGKHEIQFRFRSPSLRIGAWISLLSLLLLGVIFGRRIPQP
jgi:hypothetical protein